MFEFDIRQYASHISSTFKNMMLVCYFPSIYLNIIDTISTVPITRTLESLHHTLQAVQYQSSVMDDVSVTFKHVKWNHSSHLSQQIMGSPSSGSLQMQYTKHFSVLTTRVTGLQVCDWLCARWQVVIEPLQLCEFTPMMRQCPKRKDTATSSSHCNKFWHDTSVVAPTETRIHKLIVKIFFFYLVLSSDSLVLLI